MNLDWTRLRAVVLESDDWGLCAWSPDSQAWRALADQPPFRTPSGKRYAGSTLESAEDVKAISDTLIEFRGGDGFPPVWQANTVMSSPDYARLEPPGFAVEHLPLLDFPNVPSRWQRPRLWEQVSIARMAGLWWPELHGLHHLPEHTWLTALRRGENDARRAHEHQSPVCSAVEASGEYAATEPEAVRARNLELAVTKFRSLFGRLPGSVCPPDYRWDDRLESDAERLGIPTIQGKPEQLGHALPRLRRILLTFQWPHTRGPHFYLPPRIAFEPAAQPRNAAKVGAEAAARAVKRAWQRGQPAIVSTHRMNYVHLDHAHAEEGRTALRELLVKLEREGAVFLTDREVYELQTRRWSVREIGARGVLVRYYGVPREPIRFGAPSGVTGVSLREGRRDEGADLALANGEVEARLNDGEYLIEWQRE